MGEVAVVGEESSGSVERVWGRRGPQKYGMFLGSIGRDVTRGVAASKKISALDVILEKWVKAQVHAKTGEIVGVCEPMVIPVLDIHIPAHEAHLQPKDSGIATIV
jgi:hypothetical protein